MATLKKLAQSTATTEVTSTPGIYVAPANGTLIKKVVVSNPNAFPINLYLSHVTSGGTGSSTNRVCTGMTIPPDTFNGPTSVPGSEFICMTSGDFLTAYLANTNSGGGVVTVYGVEL